MRRYPAQRLATEPAPPYAGEGPHALWHFSEDPSLDEFEPRVSGDQEPAVWAVDTRHAPLFWFPRDCPRGTAWAVSTTTPADRERFFGHSAAPRIHVIEGAWLERMATCQLYAYRMPARSFAPDPVVAGYWRSARRVRALERVPCGNLLERHVAAHIELRIAPSIWPWWEAVTRSSLGFSGCRLRNCTVPRGAATASLGGESPATA